MTMSLIAGVAAFVLTVLAMPHFITYYKIKKIGGQQMHEDVKQHLAKAGTPTMGGTVFLVVAILVSLIFNFHGTPSLWCHSGDSLCHFDLWNHWFP